MLVSEVSRETVAVRMASSEDMLVVGRGLRCKFIGLQRRLTEEGCGCNAFDVEDELLTVIEPRDL